MTSTSESALQAEYQKQELQLKQNLKTFCNKQIQELFKATPETRSLTITAFNGVLDEILSAWVDGIYVEPIDNQRNGYEITIAYDDYQARSEYRMTIVGLNSFLLEEIETFTDKVDPIYRLKSMCTIANRVNYAFHLKGLSNPELIKF